MVARAEVRGVAWLLLTCAATPFLVPGARTADGPALRAGIARWWPVALTTALFLAVGGMMTATGMSETLAHAAAQLGPAYPAIAPWIRALGGFLTGSNTGANAMFAASQAATARVIGHPVLDMVAVQNVSASLATTASIPRVALAVSLARSDDTAGREEAAVAPASPRVSTRGPAPSSNRETTERVGIGSVSGAVVSVDAVILAILTLLSLLSVIG